MDEQFKSILAIIDKAVENAQADILFKESIPISYEDKNSFEEWSGKSFGSIKELVSTSYAKKQITFNPFAESYWDKAAALTFSIFDNDAAPAISYSLEDSPYGQILIASTDAGICYLVFFSGTEAKAQEVLQKKFSLSHVLQQRTPEQSAALDYMSGNTSRPVHLHVKGSSDNLRIWHALTKVPYGKLISYGTLAKATGHMAQDIGVAMGDNRIAILIPCHRVIKSTGELGQYHWGAKRKRAMIIKEATVL